MDITQKESPPPVIIKDKEKWDTISKLFGDSVTGGQVIVQIVDDHCGLQSSCRI